jgi:MFS family permease
LAGAIGSFVCGYISQKFGLKRSLLFFTVPLFLGWLLIFLANSMGLILFGRFITGFFVAGVGVSTSLVGELAAPIRRGRLNFLFDLDFCLGVLFIYVVGTVWPWRVQAAACATVCLIFFALLLTIPESPRCLLQQEKSTLAKKALMWSRDANENEVNDEYRGVS